MEPVHRDTSCDYIRPNHRCFRTDKGPDRLFWQDACYREITEKSIEDRIYWNWNYAAEHPGSVGNATRLAAIRRRINRLLDG